MDLRQRINCFRIIAVEVFGPYQKTCMRTSKWNALNHLVEALRHLGSMDYLDVALYESSYKRFKEKYPKSSKRRETATTEVLMKRPSVIFPEQKFSRMRNLSCQKCVPTGNAV